MPPNAVGTTINATQTSNVTVNILPNGLALDKGQCLIVIEGDDGGSAELGNWCCVFQYKLYWAASISRQHGRNKSR
jgi:hypothetical protein